MSFAAPCILFLFFFACDDHLTSTNLCFSLGFYRALIKLGRQLAHACGELSIPEQQWLVLAMNIVRKNWNINPCMFQLCILCLFPPIRIALSTLNKLINVQGAVLSVKLCSFDFLHHKYLYFKIHSKLLGKKFKQTLTEIRKRVREARL